MTPTVERIENWRKVIRGHGRDRWEKGEKREKREVRK
jgi:hypothetical protein